MESRRAETAFLTAVRRIVAQEGVPGLYAGLDSAVFGISVTNFVYYYWYEWTRSFFQRAAAAAGRPGTAGRAAAQIRLTTVESMIAGAIAGSATVILTNPIWVVNTRMTAGAQSQNKKDGSATGEVAKTTEGGATTETDGEKKPIEPPPMTAPPPTAADEPKKQKKPSTIGTLLALLREEGPQALFRGVVPALVLVVNPILQYTLFEQMKNVVERRQRAQGQTPRITPSMAFLLGALGKLFATAVTYPYITVKSRMHVAGRDERREGVFAALTRAAREEGYAGLYKGEFCFSPMRSRRRTEAPPTSPNALRTNSRQRDKGIKKIIRMTSRLRWLTARNHTGIGPKITQSVLTAAFLFAFKDVLYEQTVLLRGRVARKALKP